MSLQYSSSLTNLTEINPSFDCGKLRIAYTGKNRNNTFISKESFERAVPTMFNCPVVANYNRDADELGSHDGEWIKNKNGEVEYVMVTQPVGVIPESAKWYWEDVTDSGEVHRYLCTDVLLWKRQEAYQKIKENGITKHSMEIEVVDGKMRDDYYEINDFIFTAFCLLGTAEPCFESSALFTFSAEEQEEFKEQYTQMLKELKELGSYSQKEEVSLKLKELLKQYSVSMEDVTFDVEGLSDEELEAKFAEVFDDGDGGDAGGEEEGGEEATGGEEAADGEETPTDDDAADNAADDDDDDDDDGSDEPDYDNEEDGGIGEGQIKKPEEFVLNSQMEENLCAAVRNIDVVEAEWGAYPRYCIADFDAEAQEVYFIDMEEFKLYGCKFAFDGDDISIDVENIVRKKYDIVDYVEGSGEQTFALSEIFAKFDEAYKAAMVDADKMAQLEKFKADVLDKQRKADEEALFAEFAEQLKDNERFAALRENASDYELDELRKELFALVGQMQFAAIKGDKPKAMPGIVFEDRPKNSAMRKLFAWKENQ